MADMSISIPCSECRKSTIQLLSDLEASDKVICPFCGAYTDLTKEYWQAALRDARKAADEIEPKPD